jgi:alkanesulfonate monooxygenase SsuD/methylene tetrahydromethanopterin reductase-like flavin-dependent oxidoreductase (luciferase family)
MEKAMRIARPAYTQWHKSLIKLWVDNKVEGPAFARGTVSDVQTAIDAGTDIVGDPDYVCEEITRQVNELGVNYMLCQFYFGDMEHEDAMRSVDLFKTKIMPAVSNL